MDLVDDERVGHEDVAILEPAPRDARRDDDDVPRRRFRSRLALAIHDADLELRAEDLFSDRPDRQCLPRPGSRDDTEASPAPCELADAIAVLTFEEGLDVQTERELDGFAGGASWPKGGEAARGRTALN